MWNTQLQLWNCTHKFPTVREIKGQSVTSLFKHPPNYKQSYRVDGDELTICSWQGETFFISPLQYSHPSSVQNVQWSLINYMFHSLIQDTEYSAMFASLQRYILLDDTLLIIQYGIIIFSVLFLTITVPLVSSVSSVSACTYIYTHTHPLLIRKTLLKLNGYEYKLYGWYSARYLPSICSLHVYRAHHLHKGTKLHFHVMVCFVNISCELCSMPSDSTTAKCCK